MTAAINRLLLALWCATPSRWLNKGGPEMKTPDTAKAVSSATRQGTQIFTYPKKPASACAEVLAAMLSGEVLTAADTLDTAASMRAAAHVHYLADRYDWPIEAEKRAVGCSDGRVTTVAVYKLPADCIHAARAAGADAWIAQVRKARAAMRAKAAEAYRRAAALNKARKRQTPPGQGDLFTSGGAS